MVNEEKEVDKERKKYLVRVKTQNNFLIYVQVFLKFLDLVHV